MEHEGRSAKQVIIHCPVSKGTLYNAHANHTLSESTDTTLPLLSSALRSSLPDHVLSRNLTPEQATLPQITTRTPFFYWHIYSFLIA